jgi:hypothetical protein
LNDAAKISHALHNWTDLLREISRQLDDLAAQCSTETTHIGPPPIDPANSVEATAPAPPTPELSGMGVSPAAEPDAAQTTAEPSVPLPKDERNETIRSPDDLNQLLAQVDDGTGSSEEDESPDTDGRRAGETKTSGEADESSNEGDSGLATSPLREDLVALCDHDDDTLMAQLRARKLTPTRPMFRKGPHRCVPLGEGRSVYSLVFPHKTVLAPQVRFFELLFGRGLEGRKFRVTRLPVIAADRDDYHLSEDIVRKGTVRPED